MKVIATTCTATDGNNIESSQEIDLPMSVAAGHDPLVGMRVISANPVDTRAHESSNVDMPYVPGQDAVDAVKSVGEAVTLFALGDEVWYAGALGHVGNNSEFQLVDERITTLKPKTLDDAPAAALPLTAITAQKMPLDRLGVEKNGNEDNVLLTVGVAGGVDSILT